MPNNREEDEVLELYNLMVYRPYIDFLMYNEKNTHLKASQQVRKLIKDFVTTHPEWKKWKNER